MYYTYILRCENDSLYTGITTDLVRRFREHSRQKKGGARATGINRPVAFAAAWSSADRAEASRLEYSIKRLTHAQKLRLISGEDALPTEPEKYSRMDIDEEGNQKEKAIPPTKG